MKNLNQAFLFFIFLLLVGFTTAIVEKSHRHGIDSQPLNEIQVTSKKKYYGPCTRYRTARRTQVYIDCVMRAMNRKDI